MESMPQELRDAIRTSSPNMVVLVEITCSSVAHTFGMVSGSRRLFGYPCSIMSMTPVRSKYDNSTKQHTVGTIEFVIADDGWFRNLVYRYVIWGGRAVVKLGAIKADGNPIAQGSFDFIGEGQIQSCVPERGIFRMIVDLSASGVIQNQTTTAHFEGGHPLLITEQLLAANTATSTYDPLSFDPAKYEDMSHWSVSKTGRPPGIQPWQERDQGRQDNVRDMLNTLSHLLPGTVLPNRYGRLRYRHFDPYAPAVRHIVKNDVLEAVQQDMYANVINRSVLSFEGERFLGDWYKQRGFNGIIGIRRDEGNSQNFNQYPGSPNPRIAAESVANPWLNGMSFTEAARSGSGPWNVKVDGMAAKWGFCGTYLPPDQRAIGGSTPAALRIDPSRGRYGYICTAEQQSLNTNIQRVTAAVHDWTWTQTDEYGNVWPWAIDFTVDQAGLFGSNGSGNQFGVQVFDVTIPVQWTLDRINRYANGVPRCRLRVNLWHRDLENADLISFDDDMICGNRFRQADQATVWQIIGIEEAPIGDNKGLWLDLEWVRTDFIAYPVTTPVTLEQGGKDDGSGEEDGDGGGLKPRILDNVNDFLVISTSGLFAKLARGGVRGAGPYAKWYAESDVPLRATRDNYVFVNSVTHKISVFDVAAAAPAPTAPLGGILIWRFRTDGSGVTAQEDFRIAASKIMTGEKLVDGTVARDQLASPVEQNEFKVAETPGSTEKYKDEIHREFQTTDATATKAVQIPIGERESWVLTVTAVARESTRRAGFVKSALVFRNASGDVTLGEGGVASLLSDVSNSAYAMTIVVDTASQEAWVQVTGAAAQTVEWSIDVEMVKSFA